MTGRRVLIAPDKFKGSLSAAEVADALATGMRAEDPSIRCRILPLADGGDGSVAAALAAGFSGRELEVAGPLGRPLRTTVAVRGEAAVVESATICGMSLLGPDGLAPLRAGSAGLGEAIRAVVAAGARTVTVGLGGSASTDGGAGMLAALGATFGAAGGEERGGERGLVAQGGGALATLVDADLAGIRLSGVDLIGASDVTNPLLGPRGAAAVFGPQKGAGAGDIELLEAGLAHLVALLEAAGLDARRLAALPGAGSAGGLGFGLLAAGGRLVSGADYFLDLLGFDAAAASADLVVTGEGSLDDQTLGGKLVARVVARSAVPVVAVVGRSTLDPAAAAGLGLTGVHAVADRTAADSSRDRELTARLLTEIGREIAATLRRS